MTHDRARRALVIIACACLAALVIGVVWTFIAFNRVVDSRTGPVHRFAAPAGESFLTDDRAAAVAREVMNRDGFPSAAWEMMTDDRTKAPDGRPDRFLTRNTVDPNQGYVSFHSATSPTPTRFVNIELRDGAITAQGSLGK